MYKILCATRGWLPCHGTLCSDLIPFCNPLCFPPVWLKWKKYIQREDYTIYAPEKWMCKADCEKKRCVWLIIPSNGQNSLKVCFHWCQLLEGTQRRRGVTDTIVLLNCPFVFLLQNSKEQPVAMQLSVIHVFNTRVCPVDRSNPKQSQISLCADKSGRGQHDTPPSLGNIRVQSHCLIEDHFMYLPQPYPKFPEDKDMSWKPSPRLIAYGKFLPCWAIITPTIRHTHERP